MFGNLLQAGDFLILKQSFIDRIKKHPLYNESKKIVVARGTTIFGPDFLFVGEAPGFSENEIGLPFVGRAGQLLDRMIEYSGVDSYLISNVCPLLPLDGEGKIRAPDDSEIAYFEFFWQWVILKSQPRYIVALGDVAAKAVFNSKVKDLIGKIDVYTQDTTFDLKIKGTAIYHPARYLRVNIDEGLRDFNRAINLLCVSDEDPEELKQTNNTDTDTEKQNKYYLAEISLPVQQVHNTAVKYMISDENAFFRVLAEESNSNFKDVDSKNVFLWNDIKCGSIQVQNIPSLVEGKNLNTIAVLRLERDVYTLRDILCLNRQNEYEYQPIDKVFKIDLVEKKKRIAQRYFPIHVHTEYSVGDSINKTDALASALCDLGFEGAAVCDHGNLNGTYYAQKSLGDKGLKTCHGCEFYIYDLPDMKDKDIVNKTAVHHITVFAKNEQGWKNLLRLMYLACTEGYYYRPRITLQWLLNHKEGLICTSGCMQGFIANCCKMGDLSKANEYVDLFKEEFGSDFYIEIMPHWEIKGYIDLVKLMHNLAKQKNVKAVASLDCHYISKDDKEYHTAARAISLRKKMSDSPGYDGNTYFLMTDAELEELYKNKFGFDQNSVDEMFLNTFDLAHKCNFSIHKFSSIETMIEFPDADQELKKMCNKAFDKRIDDLTSKSSHTKKDYRDRLEFELDRIVSKGYAPYFLLVKDVVDTALQLGIMYGPGRGSVGGSFAAYLLGLHKADPLEYDLLFDRFISEIRKDTPDIDMDFQDTKRDVLIKALQNKYGEERICGVIAYSKSHGKGAIRDIARVYSIPAYESEAVANLVITRSGGDSRQNFSLLDTFNEFEKAKTFKQKYPIASQTAMGLEGTIRTFTRHAAGLVITKQPIWNYIPVCKLKGVIIAGWDKRALEDIGLVKLDILGLKTLDVIADCIEKANINLSDTFDDSKVYDNVFKTGNTLGVFQFDTHGLSKFSADMQCDSFESLFTASALYRPGCVDGNTKISFITYKGIPQKQKIKEMTRVSYRKIKTISVNKDNEAVDNKFADIYCTGDKEVFKLSSGRDAIIATAEHLFLTRDIAGVISWKKLSDLKVEDEVAKIIFENGIDSVKCKICGRRLKNLTRVHLRVCHNLSKEEYLRMFPGAKIITSKEFNKLKKQLSKMGAKGRIAQEKVYPFEKVIKKGFLASLALEVRNKIRRTNSDFEHRKLFSKNRIKFLKKHPEQHPIRVLARNGNISYKQKKLFEMVYKFYPKAIMEYPVKQYDLDIAIVDKKIDFEYDGEFWHSNVKCKIKDQKRDKLLKKLGWRIFRFNKDNFKQAEEMIAKTI